MEDPKLSRLAAAFAQYLPVEDRRAMNDVLDEVDGGLSDVPEPWQSRLREFARKHPDERWDGIA